MIVHFAASCGRYVLLALASALVVRSPLVYGQVAPAATDKPNVVLIITDDAGYGDFGCFGAKDIKTPHIDGLAAAGVRLTDFYAMPQCTPTRVALITGRYQQRVGLERAFGTDQYSLTLGLRPNGRSLPQLLKKNGYATALIGKWHIGFKPQFSPNAHGFDYFFGFHSGYVDYYQHTRGVDDAPDLWENGNPVDVPGYMTDLITEKAIDFVDRHAAEPFFLQVAYSAPHWPYQPPDEPSTAPDHSLYQAPIDDDPPEREVYAAMVERVDRGVGEILAALERCEIADDTFVIFTNDNGGEWLSDNGPLFHRKDSVWEGGVRVPAIMRWPGRLPSGEASPQVGIVLDLTASILAATNTSVPDDVKLDGIDLLPILAGKHEQVERTLFWRVRSRYRQQYAVRHGPWKFHLDGDDMLLFNVAKDVGERDDLSRERPDVIGQLWPKVIEWNQQVDAEAQRNPLPGP